MLKKLSESLSKLKANSVRVLSREPEAGGETIAQLIFSDGSKLEFVYWRIIRDGKERVSSFDHRQQYGLPTPIDAIKELQKELQDKTITEAHFDKETGDLLLQFTKDVKLQIFAFSGYEVWEIIFSDGTGEWSNYAKD